MALRLESLPLVISDPLLSPRTTQRIISKIATIFQLSLSENAWQSCFDAALDASQQRKWELVSACKNELTQLTDQFGRPLLLHIILSGDRALALELIEQKITLLALDREGNTALHLAARAGDLEIIGKLYGKISIDAQNFEGQTPLHVAIEAGQSDVVLALLTNQANKDAPFIYHTLKVTPLSYAVIRGELECVQALCRQANISQTLTALGNLLHLAVHFQQNEVLDYLLKHHTEACKALIEQQDNQGHTPVALAVLVDNYQAISLLHAYGTNLESQDFLGRSPLHHAAEKLNENLIKYLYFLGCKLTATDHQNLRPVDLITGSHEEARLTKNLLNTLMSRDKNIENKPPQFAYQPPQSIVFKGGGPKGLAYVGAQRVLQTKGILKFVLRFAGTSAGAINATMLAFNYSYEEMLEILGDPNFLKSLLDVDPHLDPKLKSLFEDGINNRITFASVIKVLFGQTQLARGILAFLQKKTTSQVIESSIPNLWTRTGFCLGDKLRLWIEEQIQKKSGIELCTFRELRELIRDKKPFRHLHIFATKLGNAPTPVHFTSEESSWADDIIISDAVRASMSIPVAYIPHILHRKINGQRIPCTELGTFVDGGLTYNFPVEFADRKKYIFSGLSSEEGNCPIFNKRTLGFSLYSPEEKEIPDSLKIENIGQLIQTIIDLYSNAETVLRQMNPYNMHRVIEIDNKGVGLLEFDMTPEKQQRLLQSGASAIEVFLDKQGEAVQENSLFNLPRILKEVQRTICLNSLHPHLIRRTAILEELEQALLHKQSAVHVLYGPGGIGKSELAITFANFHLEDFSLVWSLQCGSLEEKMYDYRLLATTLKAPITDRDTEEMIIRKVHLKLEQNKGKPWLLIFDNYQSSIPIPERGGVVLITSYERRPNMSATEVPPFEEKEAIELLEKVTRRKTADFLKLIELTGCYPLILGQAASYIHCNDISILYYIDLLKKNVNAALPSDRYNKTLEAALDLTLQQLSDQALEWFHMCCYLNPARIPLSYLTLWISNKYSSNRALHAQIQERIVASLHSRALVRFDSNAESFSLHLSLKKAVRRIKNEEALANTITLLTLIGSRIDLDNSSNWNETYSELTLWISHIYELKSLFTDDSENYGSISLKIGDYELTHGRYQKALFWYERAEKNFSKHVSPKQLELAASLNNQGYCYFLLGKWKKALKFHIQALEIRKKFQNKNPSAIALSLNHIGSCYSALGDYSNALNYIERSHLSWLRCLGPKHLKIASVLNNKGLCLQHLGRYDEAMHCYEEALCIQEKNLSNTHPLLALTRDNIGTCFFAEGKIEQALEAHQAALEIQRATIGEEHPQTATTFNDIGTCYMKQKKHDKALKEYEHALQIQTSTFCGDHSEIAVTLNNIGCYYQAKENVVMALKYHSHALDIQRRTLPPRHPAIATTLNNMGTCFNSLKDFEKAYEKHTEAYEIKKETFGELHPSVATSLNNRGTCFHHDNQYDQAIKIHEDALKIQRKILDKNHPDIAHTLDHIAFCYQSKKEYELALEILAEELKILQSHPHDNHNSLASCFFKKGRCYFFQKNYSQALNSFEQAYTIWLSNKGQCYEDVCTCLESIAECHKILKEYKHASIKLEEAYNLFCEYAENPERKMKILIKWGEVCFEASQFNRSLKKFMQAFSIVKELEKEPEAIIYCLEAMGNCLFKLKKYDQATEKYKEALEKSRKAHFNQPIKLAKGYYVLGVSYCMEGKFCEALDQFEKALILIKKHPNNEISLHISLYKILGDCYLKLENPREAKYNYEQAYNLALQNNDNSYAKIIEENLSNFNSNCTIQ